MVFTYQQWKKRESEQRIINALNDGDKSFGDLLEQTELSKPILSKRLKSLTKQDKIDIVPEKKTKRFLYHLLYESLDDVEKSLVLLHVLSKYAVAYLAKFAKDPSVSNEEYVKRLMVGIKILFTFKMWATFLAPKPVQVEWYKNTLGLEFVRMMPKLLSENRPILPYIFDEMSPKEQAVYKSENVKEAANQLLEHLKTLVEKLPRKQIDTV